jgi:Xaa-Pro aminopeptidase
MPIIPTDSILTLEERDRRWKNVREAMGRRGLDCLIVWGSQGSWGGFAANLRYLSNLMEQGYLVFPVEGEPTIFSFESGQESPWIKDGRTGQPAYASAISGRLKELHFESARIGIVGLSGYWGEMGFPYTAFKSLMDTLPAAKFEDATYIVEKARLVKSAAEIRCFELGCEVGLEVIQAIADTAKAGVRDFEVRARIMDTLFRNGCEPDSMILYFSGKEAVHGAQGGRHAPAGQKALEPGDLITVEFDAKYGGYIAQFNQPFSVGEPDKELKAMFGVVLDSLDNGLVTLRPGITAGELDEAFLSPIRNAGYRTRNPAFHGLGLYLEMPMGCFEAQPSYKPDTSFRIESNMVIEFEPHVVSPDGKRGIHIGSPVLVTETGCRLLTKNWKPELIVV